MATEQTRFPQLRPLPVSFLWRVLVAIPSFMIWVGVAFGQTSPHGKLAVPCEACHTANSWRDVSYPLTFEHGKTGFPLKGQHTLVRCTQCHTSLAFTGTQRECASCHKDVHRGELGVTCGRCHSPQSWVIPDMVQRHASTRFPLLGAHANAACQSCHKNQQKHEYVGVSSECFSCHMTDFQNSRSPDHKSAGFSTDCVQCHSVTADRWGTGFDHGRVGFPLLGAHQAAACISCHAGNAFKGIAIQCIGCHQQAFASTTAPPHTGFPTECTSCHSVSSWRPATFDHNKTAFRLTGAHLSLPCNQCHVNNVYAGTPTQCFSCHGSNYTNTVNPKHSPGFPTDCMSCHTTAGWRPATFNHSTSRFPLIGAHQAATCTQCHVNNVYTGTSTQCGSCHQGDYANALNPKHSPGLPTDCASCHTATGWRPSTFDHNATAFQLTGAHLSLPCTQCHVNNVYAGTPTQCFSCHESNYTNTVNPKHSPGFPTDCASCHTTTGWQPATFDHSATAFRLTGAHLALPCSQCHVNNVYAGTPVQCFNCHESNYTNTVNPKHSPGFSTDCKSCHTTAGWRPATFDHSTASFQLTGAHLATPCGSCHEGGVYTGTPSTCGNSACHLSLYNATTNPQHAASGFPTDCQNCHTTTAWQPSTFNHNQYFPISSGSRHAPGRWSACLDCHTVPTNFQIFSCIDCHAHSNKSEIDSHHAGRSGYSYNSTACYQCHPRGN
jgi:3-dehydroquinate dehydratase